MKKIFLMFALCTLFAELPAQTAQSNPKKIAIKDSISYHCPMRCLKDKHYAKDGSCDACGMKLVKDKPKK